MDKTLPTQPNRTSVNWERQRRQFPKTVMSYPGRLGDQLQDQQ